MQSDVLDYMRVNETFKQKFTFRLGYDAGFFSEYNNMVFAILYCLKNGFQFNLSSTNSNISKGGWLDFFQPFCKENNSFFHQSFNYRGHHVPGRKEKIAVNIYHLITGNLLTQDGWKHFHSRDFESAFFDVARLGIHATLLEASEKIVDITWRYNEQTSRQVFQKLASLELENKPFVGLHIRRGDKISEIENNTAERYMEVVTRHSSVKDIFVATDDYAAFESLRSNFTDYHFYTFSTKKNSGFDYHKHSVSDAHTKRQDHIDLFSDIEMLAKAEIFVGTFSSNIGMYMGMRKAGKNVYGVDFEKWMIW